MAWNHGKDINNTPNADATIKDHLTQIKHHTRSTTINKNIGEKHAITYPSQEQDNGKTEIVMATVDKNHKLYTN